VVLTPRRWRQVFAKQFVRRRWQTSPVTGESAEETVKTIAQGRPGETGEPVVTTLVCFFIFAREAAGALATRLSLRPLFSRAKIPCIHSDAPRREIADARPVIASDKRGAFDKGALATTASVEAQRAKAEAIHLSSRGENGLRRGACHRAHVRATRWLAMTMLGCLKFESEGVVARDVFTSVLPRSWRDGRWSARLSPCPARSPTPAANGMRAHRRKYWGRADP
jgi:hypothetical protein